MPDCAVIDCSYRSQASDYQSFPLPENSALKAKWVNSLKRSNFKATKTTYICSRHFSDEDFLENPTDTRGRPLKKRKLKDESVPTLFMVPEPIAKIHDHRKTRKSIDSLETEKKGNLKEISDLKKKIQLQEELIESQRRQIINLDEKDKINSKKVAKSLGDMKAQLDTLKSVINKIFTDDQIERMKCPGTRKVWSNLALQQSIVIYLICGSTAYRFLLGKGYPFAPISTLQRHMARVDFEAGILNDIFLLMKLKMEDLEPHQRIFGIVMDEMAIQPKIDFDPGTESYIGHPTIPINPVTVAKRTKKDPDYVYDQTKDMATHAMNIMACGQAKRVKQILFWGLTTVSFDPKYVANLLKEIIRRCLEVGMKIAVVTLDMSGSNLPI